MGMDVLSPFSFYGGKAKMAPLICSMLDYDNTDIYIEPFGGACRVLLNKPRHKQEIYNDFGAGLYEFFNCMSKPEHSAQVISALYDLVPSEEVFHEMRDYKIEHETELTDYMVQQFKKFVYRCNRKYTAQGLSRLHSCISQKEYADIISISKDVLRNGVIQDKGEEEQLKCYLRLYETYWGMVKEEYITAYKIAEKAFDKEWNTKALTAQKNGKVIRGSKAQHKHIASHTAALHVIGEMTADTLISNGAESTLDSVKMAVATFASYYMSRDGMGLDYSEAKCRSWDAYYRQLVKLEDVAARMEDVAVMQLDAKMLTAVYCQNSRAMIYLDPSYLNPEDTSKDLGKGIYNRSFDYELHEELALLIREADAKIILSNYDTEPYKSILDEKHGWKRMEFETTTGVGNKKDNLRTEVLWYNY